MFHCLEWETLINLRFSPSPGKNYLPPSAIRGDPAVHTLILVQIILSFGLGSAQPSPTAADGRQQHVAREGEEFAHLAVDYQTKWNSLYQSCSD